MAEVQQDASPSATAVAPYTDTGPGGATAGSQYNQSCSSSGGQPPPPQVCQNPNNQAPYARAQYPGPSHGHIDQCSGCGNGPRADADAAQLNASASAYNAGGDTQPFSGARGATSTVMDPAGTLTVITHSEGDSFTVGTVRVSKIVVDVNATGTLSSAGGDAHVQGGQVTANGQPVSVDDQGVTITDQHTVPCPSVPKPPPVQPSAPVNPLPVPIGGGSGGSSGGSPWQTGGCVPALDVTYIKLWTVAPTKPVDGSHVTIWATGLHIMITHPSPGPAVPTQTAQSILGEGFSDLQVGSAGAAFGLGAFGGFGGGDFGGFRRTGRAGRPGAAAGPLRACL